MAKPIPKKIIKAVLERDEGICQYCGRQGVNIHHIVPAGMGGKRIHIKENLITLCLDCHSRAHSNREMREFTYEWSRRLYGDVIDKLLELKWSNEK
jgi:5-methylcytosine-specific restriction endonuclease McrA